MKKRNWTILLIFALLCNSGFSIAQFSKSPVNDANSFAEAEKSFLEWKKTNDLKKEKGWKWFVRWHESESQRLNGDGTRPDPRVYFEEVRKIADNKASSSQKTSGVDNWLPCGPSVLPSSPNYYGSYGMGRINCVAFHPTDSATLFVGVAQGGVWKSTNSGQSWTPLTDNLPITRISDIAIDPTNPNTMYIAVGDYAYIGVSLKLDDRKRNTHYGLGIYKTIDGGQTWNPTGLAFSLTNYDQSLILKTIINPTNTQELVACGVQGVWHSADGGATWTKKYSELIWDMEQSLLNPNVLYASTGFVKQLVQGNAGIIKSADFGKTWTQLNTGIPTQGVVQRIELAISPQNDNYVYAIACSMDNGFYAFYRSADGGSTWENRFNRVSSGKNILSYSDGNGESGGQGPYDLAIVVDPQNKDRVYIGGINMWGTADGGATWDGISYWVNNYYGPYLHADQHFLNYNPRSGFYYMCNDGGIYRTKAIEIGSWDQANAAGAGGSYQFPTKWAFIGSGMQISSFYRLSVGPDNPASIITGAQDNSTFYYDGTAWTNVIGGDGMDCIINPDAPTTLIGSSQFGNFYKSTDNGINFSDCSPNGQGEWTTPIAYQQSSTSLYIAEDELYKSNDFGDSWTSVSSFASAPPISYNAPASALAVSKGNSDRIYVAKRIYHSYSQPSLVYTTNNGGLSWQDITAGLPDSLYFTSLATDETDDNHAWITCSGFASGVKIFETNNGGASWTNISYNLPNLPVNCVVQHAHAPTNYTIYVATDLGVYYLRKGENVWNRYSNLLPNVIVTDLEVHAKSQMLYASTFGRGVWKTQLLDATVGISDGKSSPIMSFNVSPSPNKGSFTIAANTGNTSEISLEIIDIMGRIVHKELIKSTSAEWNKNLTLNLRSGTYFASLVVSGRIQVQRFIVE